MIPVRPAPRPNGWLVWCGSRIGWWFSSPVVSLSCRPSSHLRSGVGQGVDLLGVSSVRCGAVSGLSRVGKHKNNDNNTKKRKNNHHHHRHHHHHQSPNDRVFRPSQNSPLRKTTNTPPPPPETAAAAAKPVAAFDGRSVPPEWLEHSLPIADEAFALWHMLAARVKQCRCEMRKVH